MPTIHLVPHTHWDREWYLAYQQFRFKLVHLIDNLLQILKTDPKYLHFTLDGQTIVLEDYLEIRPEAEAELAGFIKDGRILIGPWYILPDEFLVSPESLVRNLIVGDRVARRFGPTMMVGYIPDPFGHISQMPQILRGFGIQSASVQRGLSDEPVEFWWMSPDGSKVFMAYLRDGYGNAAGLLASNGERFSSEVQRLSENLVPYSAARQPGGPTLLMFGTDHMEPSIETTAAIDYANSQWEDGKLIISTLPAYILQAQSATSQVRATFPTISGELRSSKRSPLLPGVLSTRIWIKQRNQACETLLERWAEPWTAFYAQVDKELRGKGLQPRRERAPELQSFVQQAWKLLLTCHPHDSICGCSIDQVHDEMRPRFDQVEQIAEEVTQRSLEGIAQYIDTRPPAAAQAFQSVVVFNPTSQPRTDAVTAKLQLPVGVQAFEIIDEHGEVLPHQVVGMGSQELIHVSLDKKALKDSLGMIHEGRVAGMLVQSIEWKREGSQVTIEVILSESGEPNLAAWENALRQADESLADPGLTTFTVRACSAPAAQAVFSASDIPGCGYRTFWIRSAALPEPAAAQTVNPWVSRLLPVAQKLMPLLEGRRGEIAFDKPPYRIENDFFQVEVTASDGSATLVDKRSGAVFRGLNRLVDGGDCGDEYNFCPPETDQIISGLRVRGVRIERGPVQQVLEVHGRMRLPVELAPGRKSRSAQTAYLPVITRLALTRGVARLDIHTEIDNYGPSADEPARIRDHRLRVHFPAPFNVQEASYDGHYEIIQRPTAPDKYDLTWVEQPRPEKPQRYFTAIQNAQAGLAVANRGLPEVEVISTSGEGSEIALTLMRCVGWLSRDDFTTRKGHAGPFLPAPGAQLPGKHAFDYAVIPYNPETAPLLPYHQASAFNAPLRSASAIIAQGPLLPSASMVSIPSDAFAISAIKTSEDGAGWVARGYNLLHEPVQVKLAPLFNARRAWKANLAEEKFGDLPIAADGSVTFTARACEIVTIRWE